MNENIQIAVQNLESTTDLEEKTATFRAKAITFKTRAKKVNKIMWCRNLKWSICCWILVIVGASCIIGGCIYFIDN